MNKKSLLRTANFAPPPSLLSSVPNAVKIGSGVGAGLGLLQGAGVLESDAEKKATNVGNRLGKVLTSSTRGAGLGAGAGLGVHRRNLANAPERELVRRETKNKADLADIAASRPNRLKREIDAVTEKIQPIVSPTREQKIAQTEKEIAKKLEKQNTQELPPPIIDQAISWERNIAAKTQEKIGGLLDRLKGKGSATQKETGGGSTPNTINVNATTELSKMIRKSANFQDPATLQRLIQYGSTYIPQPTAGVVSLDASLKSKMQKKKIQMTRSSMGAKEVNSMIESGKPVGKYFSKTVRKSANFNFINNTLVGAGKMLTQPTAKAVRKAANGSGVSLGTKISSVLPFGDRDAAKATLGLSKTLHGAANYLETDKAAKLAAIGVGGTALAGGGLLAAKLAHQDNENKARYSKTVRKSASFGMIPSQLISGAQKAVAGTAKRFTNLSPQINAANVGTAVGGTLGALEGSGVNETEEQRRSTGLVGRAGKVLGMTGLGAGVGRGVGSAAGYGINQKKLQDWRSNNKGMAKKGVDTTKPRSINVQDENE